MAVELVEPVKRVEHYLYALCVMDFNNIPIPRSRLEFFVHALITGVLPEFQAETREEVYITAIITGDYANLPLPKSRADQLLYKICLGETEIRDIELETRYEMLLAYIAEHGDMPLETVLVECVNALQTIPNTVEVPVKSAILKGQTLVNSFITSHYQHGGVWGIIFFKSELMVKGKKYIIVLQNLPENCQWAVTNNDGSVMLLNYTDQLRGVFTSSLNGFEDTFALHINDGETIRSLEELQKVKPMLIEYQDGMENWDIPYFEGMQSVKMPVLTTTGKNLFDINFINTIYSNFNNNATVKIDNNSFTMTSSANNRSYLVQNKPIILKPNTVYKLSLTGYSTGDYKRINIGSSNGVDKNDYRTITLGTNEATYSTQFRTNKSGHVYINFYPTTSAESLTTISNIQLEEGFAATPYEPYKTNILTVNDDVTLRGIGNVRDTLDCLTSEVVQNIGEIMLNGSNYDFSINNNTDTIHLIFNTRSLGIKKNGLCVCDKLPYKIGSEDMEHVRINADGNIVLWFNKSKFQEINKSFIQTYLFQNPVRVQYELAEKSIKTVVLTITDQDGNAMPCLSTFNDATYVSINAVDIIPQVDLEVRVDANTMANVASQQENVAVAQASLSDAIDTQNDDITMTKQALDEVKGE